MGDPERSPFAQQAIIEPASEQDPYSIRRRRGTMTEPPGTARCNKTSSNDK
jgi:hypothetical protein